MIQCRNGWLMVQQANLIPLNWLLIRTLKQKRKVCHIDVDCAHFKGGYGISSLENEMYFDMYSTLFCISFCKEKQESANKPWCGGSRENESITSTKKKNSFTKTRKGISNQPKKTFWEEQWQTWLWTWWVLAGSWLLPTRLGRFDKFELKVVFQAWVYSSALAIDLRTR